MIYFTHMDPRGKRLLTIAAIVIILFLGVTAYFIFFKKTTPTQIVDINGNLVPFDQRSNQVNQLPVIGDNSQLSVDQLNSEEIPAPASSRERLRKITSFPISGFVSFLINSIKTETIIDPKTGKEITINKPITIHHVRYNDQRTGHIFNGIITDESILNSKITKTDLPSAEELYFDKTGNIGYLRYEKNNSIETFKLIIPPPPTLPNYCNYVIEPDLKISSKGDAVKNLQLYLNSKLGLQNKVDGVFGNGTAGLVKQIQKTFLVPLTGITDEPTRTSINLECDTIRQEIQKSLDDPITLKGSVVTGYLSQITKNNTENSLFYLLRQNGKTKGYLQSFTGNTGNEVFSSSFNEWMPQFVNKNLITLTTYASAVTDGYMYGLDPQNRTFSKLLGPYQGLTTLTSPDGTKVLAGFTENDQLATKIINLTNGTVKNLPFITLPEKCSWYSNDQLFCGIPKSFTTAIYPDDWYKGTIGFSDVIWSYIPSTGRSIQIATPNEPVDIFRMESYPDVGYLFFMNKNNYELWSYRISGDD
jgi:peptidoglycan hydrolase-like protein with peptidoglycan-binding domain